MMIVTATNAGLLLIFACMFSPSMAYLYYWFFRLVFGTLYPAYASYKAVKTKNVKEYVKWMMYWIVFALFTCLETFADILVSFWLPFYYELKVMFVLWLLSPYTQGSSVLYRKFVHPELNKREQEIDECIAQFREKGYKKLVEFGSKGMTFATNVVLMTAMKGQETIVNQIKKSYSMNDLSNTHLESRPVSRLPYIEDEVDDISDQLDNRLVEEDEHSRRKMLHDDSNYKDYVGENNQDIDDEFHSSEGNQRSAGSRKKHRRTGSGSSMKLRSRSRDNAGGFGDPYHGSYMSRKSEYDKISAYATIPKTSNKRTKKKLPVS